jgi:kynurenine formamidase
MIFPYKLIDLTHSLDSNIPTWNGGCGFNHDVHIDYSDCKGEDKFRIMKVKMDAGIFTHMDAPSHYITGGKYIHDFDVNDFIMPCVVIDILDKCHENYSLNTKDIVNFENKYGKISPGYSQFCYAYAYKN